MATRILLVRHGGTIFTADDRFAGAMDVALSPAGKEQAAQLGQRLAGITIDAAYASPMTRARETAKAALGTRTAPLELKLIPDLREIDYGHWEGLTRAEAQLKHPVEWAAWSADPFSHPPAGGESGLAVLSRSLAAIQQIVSDNDGKTVLVVSHKAVNRLLIALHLGIDLREYRERIDQSFAALNVLTFKTVASARLDLLNDCSHYSTLPPQ